MIDTRNPELIDEVKSELVTSVSADLDSVEEQLQVVTIIVIVISALLVLVLLGCLVMYCTLSRALKQVTTGREPAE